MASLSMETSCSYVQPTNKMSKEQQCYEAAADKIKTSLDVIPDLDCLQKTCSTSSQKDTSRIANSTDSERLRINEKEETEKDLKHQPRLMEIKNFVKTDANKKTLEYAKHFQVSRGDCIGSRKFLKEVGLGCYGTVWLVHNLVDNSYSATKIVNSSVTDTAVTEIKVCTISFIVPAQTSHFQILNRIKESGTEQVKNLFVELLSHTRGIGQLAQFDILTLEFIGPTLSEVMEQIKAFHFDHVRSISKQLLCALNHLHKTIRVIHADVKPPNVMVKLDFNDMKKVIQKATDEIEGRSSPSMFYNIDFADSKCRILVKLGDFGHSQIIKEDLKERVQTCSYRAPEVLLQNNYGPAIDLWSHGCLVYEIATGFQLFPCSFGEENLDHQQKHFGLILKTLGHVEARIYEESCVKYLCFGRKKVIGETVSDDCLVQRLSSLGISNEHAVELRRFLNLFLQYNPKIRVEAGEAISDHFHTAPHDPFSFWN
ncbi:unnamed protein product [Caenorhabditis brenneri]